MRQNWPNRCIRNLHYLSLPRSPPLSSRPRRPSPQRSLSLPWGVPLASSTVTLKQGYYVDLHLLCFLSENYFNIIHR